MSTLFRNYFYLFYCAALHIFKPSQHNSLAHLASRAMLLIWQTKQDAAKLNLGGTTSSIQGRTICPANRCRMNDWNNSPSSWRAMPAVGARFLPLSLMRAQPQPHIAPFRCWQSQASKSVSRGFVGAPWTSQRGAPLCSLMIQAQERASLMRMMTTWRLRVFLRIETSVDQTSPPTLRPQNSGS